MPFDLTNKTVLVTGAGSGIGAAIAETFARANAQVFVTDRDPKTGGETVARIRAANGRAEFLPLEVTKEADCLAAVERVGSLDILINNAGIGHVGTMLTTTGDDMDRLYAVNVRGMFNVTKAFLPGMVARRSGVIINLASVGGVVGVRDRLAYCTTKFAVVGLTKSMALDHALAGIRVNCICPGRVETPFVQARLKEYPDPAAAYREMAATQAVGRMGKPEEIAAAALYLASDEAAFITGTAFLIDGGFSAGK
ncbi:MAG: short-chain dehydrogenase [Lentisphaerae bacterium RIFOXYB12_FULL_65_16]|nr:MAG: short-chain dehydrogenase [Lentisphaerae bacterium RIFOXYA12_64_32]OGV92612.1 MAG: short-chain dehydrogenase [Lentisphaerae bacterium RIFOXYB12_FULL_65_16]